MVTRKVLRLVGHWAQKMAVLRVLGMETLSVDMTADQSASQRVQQLDC